MTTTIIDFMAQHIGYVGFAFGLVVGVCVTILSHGIVLMMKERTRLVHGSSVPKHDMPPQAVKR